MQVIPPVEITTSKLTSSTVPEEVAATYNSGTTYAAGALAGAAPVYGSAQIVWRSLQNGNTGNAQVEGAWWTKAGEVYPVYNGGDTAEIGEIVTDLASHSLYESLAASNSSPLSDTTKWKYIGKTNRWKMFDYTRNDKTLAPLTFTVVIAPGRRINSIALVGIQANDYSISVSSTYGGGVVYAKSGTLTIRNTRTWSEYYWGEFGTRPSVVFFDVPPYTDNVITVTLTADSGEAGLRALIVGTFVSLGQTEIAARSDVINFSTVERDADGNAILDAQRNIPKTSQRIWCKKSDVNRIKQAREDLNAQVAIWYALLDDEDGYFEIFAVLGFYRTFVIDAAYPQDALISLELEEV